MSESESAIDDPLSKPMPEASLPGSFRCWFPRWFRILIAGVLVAVPVLILTFEDVDDGLAFSVLTWSAWGVIAFVAMQGPGQWRSIIAGSLYGIVLAFMAVLFYRWFRPNTFASWGTFWNFDFPFYAMDLAIGWCLLRMLSMIGGIEIIDPHVRMRPRWTLARWMVLMAVLAVFIQVSITRLNWTAEMSMGSYDTPMLDPLPENPVVTSRRFWLGIQLIENLFIPFVPLLAAGWMLAGRPWRWLMFPFLAGMTIGEYALARTLFLQAIFEEPWLKNLFSPMESEWALAGALSWFAYCFAAILVPWMGFRWTDYWSCTTRFAQSPQPPTTA